MSLCNGSALGAADFTFLSYALAVFGILVALYMAFFILKYRLNKKYAISIL
jgi:hypothetical protein